MDKKAKTSLQEQLAKSINRLTIRITYIVLISFIIILAFVLGKAWAEYKVDKSIETAEVWLNIFKDGFLILSGVLTTLIGYYFGSKGSEVVLDQYKEVSKKAETLEENLERSSPSDEDQTQGMESFPQ
ncbi:hypothetical protein [Winogradskyella sp. 3972H.M.0a.05]|uniref:hypothetical protein n=1 Tax=Winogradskyella sp. 3972H.M.0a.05 TaxID=2950277 RepID=UPI00339123A1